MPSGLLSLMIPLCLLVLLASGWRREISGDVPLPATLVVVCAPVLAGLSLHAGPHLTFSADQTVYMAAACLAILPGKGGTRRMVGLLLALLIGLLYYLPYAMERSAFPWPGSREWLVPLAAGFLAAIFLNRPQGQFASLWLGLVLATWWGQQWRETVHVFVGGRGFADALWLSLVGARLITELFRLAGGGASRLLSRHK